MRSSGLIPRTFFGLLVLVLGGCAHQTGNQTAQLIPPQLVIRQLGGPGAAARHVTGGIVVNYSIDVINPSSETITLDQLRLESLGQGAYLLRATQRPFDRKILPDHVETVEFWAPAMAQDTILGVNGPVTLRAVAFFSSPVGAFQKIYVQQVNEKGGGEAPPPR